MHPMQPVPEVPGMECAFSLEYWHEIFVLALAYGHMTVK